MITVTISKGAISHELTNFQGLNLVLRKTIEIRESEYGSDFSPSINSASFTMLFAGIPAALMLEDDVEISIVEDSEPIFTGYVRPLSEVQLRRSGVGDRIAIECEGCMSRLDAEHDGDIVDLGSSVTVYNPASQATSYVHRLLARMTWAAGISGPTLAQTMPIATIRKGEKLLSLIAKALFCAGHYLTELPDGSLAIKPFVVTTPVSSKSFSVAARNIIGDLQINREESEEKAIALTYGKYNKVKTYAILATDVKHVIYARYYLLSSCDRKPFVWPYNISSEGTPAHLNRDSEDAAWVWNDRYGTILKKLNAAGEETAADDLLIALPSPSVSNLVPGMWKYSDLSAEVIFLDNCVINAGWTGSYRRSGKIKAIIAADGSITYKRIIGSNGPVLEADHPLKNSVTASWGPLGLSLKIGPIPYTSNDQHLIYIEGYTIYGSLSYIHSNPAALADTDAPRDVEGSGKQKKVSAEFCLQPADAEGIAKALRAGLSCPRASFVSNDQVDSGAIVTVLREGRGIDILGRIVARKYTPDIVGKRFGYEVEGLEDFAIESDYLPSITAGRGIDQSAYQTTAELIEARARQAAAELEAKQYSDDILANASHVFYTEPIGPYSIGDLWISNGVLYQSTVDRAAGEYVSGDWIWCIRSNVTVIIQSSNGDKFKPGQSTSTILTPFLFKNGIDVTASYPDSAFKWLRNSFFTPNNDATWNANHATGYRTVEVSTDSIYARATYTLEISE